MLVEMISGGLYMSFKPASTRPQLATGPQKCVVFGPTSEFQKARRACRKNHTGFELKVNAGAEALRGAGCRTGTKTHLGHGKSGARQLLNRGGNAAMKHQSIFSLRWRQQQQSSSAAAAAAAAEAAAASSLQRSGRGLHRFFRMVTCQHEPSVQTTPKQHQSNQNTKTVPISTCRCPKTPPSPVPLLPTLVTLPLSHNSIAIAWKRA